MANNTGSAMPAGMKGYEETPEYGATLDKGDYDVSLAKMGWNRSRSGNVQCIATFVVDNGSFSGTRVKEYYPLEGNGAGIGAGKLKSLGIHSGLDWDLKPSMDEFVEQFVDFDDPLRINVTVGHQLNIKKSGTWKNDASENEYDAWDGKKNKRPKLMRYRPAREEPTVKIVPQVDRFDEDEFNPDELENEDELKETDEEFDDKDLPWDENSF